MSERNDSVFPILQYVSGLAVERPADRVESIESHTAYFAGLQLGKIDIGYADALGELVQRHFPVRHHTVESQNYSHTTTPLKELVVLFLKSGAVPKDQDDRPEDERADYGSHDIPAEECHYRKEDADDLQILDRVFVER